MDGPLVALDGVAIRYPSSAVPVVRDVSLSVETGDRLLITGPSGSGKSTLLFAMAGIIPESIPARIEGRLSLNSGGIGVVLQNPESQMVTPTVEGEIAFGLENIGMPRDEMETRVAEILEQFGIQTLRNRNPATLSGGEAQKVALAAALAPRPDLLLLDEPTAFLDPRATRGFVELLTALDPRVALVLVEHKIEYLHGVIDRYIMLDSNGTVAEEGGPDGLPAYYWFGDRTASPPQIAGPRKGGMSEFPAAETPPVLEVDRLSHRFGDAVALEEISFVLHPGETVVVMGPNGSGKSTLLDRIAGTQSGVGSSRRPANPPIRFLGQDIGRMRDRLRYSHLFSVPQNPEHLFLANTVGEEIDLQISADERTKAAIRKRFRLEDATARNPYSLSEGEKRRVNLACAFLDPRDLILLDEPTYGLDSQAILELVEVLRAFKDEGRTVLLVTHSPELAFLVADRLLVLDAGRIRYAGNAAGFAETARGTELDDYIPAWLRVTGGIR